MVKVSELTNNEYLEKLLRVITENEGEQKANDIKKQFEEKLPQQEFLVCIDCETDDVIGYSKTTALTHGILKLDYLYVLPSCRRDTNGSIILVAVYNRAVNRMTAGIIAECENDNEGGNAFLKARGFLLAKSEDSVNFYTKSLMHMYIPHKHED